MLEKINSNLECGEINNIPVLLQAVQSIVTSMQLQLDNKAALSLDRLKTELPKTVLAAVENTRMGDVNLNIGLKDYDCVNRLETRRSVNCVFEHADQYWFHEPIGLVGKCIYLSLEFDCFDKQESLELLVPVEPTQPLFLLDLFLTSGENHFQGSGLGSVAMQKIVIPIADILNKNILLAISRPKEIDFKVILGSMPVELIQARLNEYVLKNNLKGQKKDRVLQYLALVKFYQKHGFRQVRRGEDIAPVNINTESEGFSYSTEYFCKML